MVIFLPPLFWEWLEGTSVFRKWSLVLRGWMLRGARTFKAFENLSTLHQNEEPQTPKVMERSLLWEIPLVSEEEQLYDDRVDVSKSPPLLQPKPTKLNRILSCFFLVYLVINNLGDVQLKLFPKPDGGNIGELLRLDQQWVMYGPDVLPTTSFDLLVGEIEVDTAGGRGTEIKRVVLNDLLTSDWTQVTVFEGEDTYKRPWNPTNINSNMRWERLFVKVSQRSDMMDSVLFWFCKHIKGRTLRLRYQDPGQQYDDGRDVRSELVTVHKMVRAGWCSVEGEIINLWEMNKTIGFPQYKNERTRCYHQMACR